jgi:hypothetical protein
VELLAIGLDILDPGLDGLEAVKLVNDQAIAEVDPELLAVGPGRCACRRGAPPPS